MHFKISNFEAIEYLCKKGYVEIFKIYFPLYISKSNKASVHTANSYSILSSNLSVAPAIFPIHLACIYGHIEIVIFLFNFFKDKKYIPKEFNINSVEERSGNNCALLACKGGHLELVKFLHKECQADFHIINNFEENAIIVTIAGMNKDLNFRYIGVLNYLIDDVKVDLKFRYEEAAFSAKCSSAYNLLAQALKKHGIDIGKREPDDLSFELCESQPGEEAPIRQKILSDSFVANTKPENVQSVVSTIRDSFVSSNFRGSEYFFSI